MSRKKKLIILLIVLAVCVCGYLIISYFVSGDSEDEDSIEISVIDSDSVESIKWVYDGNDVELQKDDDDLWYYVDDSEFPLDQDIAADMLSAVSSIYAVKKVADEPDDLSSYGIDEPSVKIYVTVDGETTEYDIGDYNESSGYYYMMYTGDEALYYVDSTLYDTFAVTLLEIVEYEYLPEIDESDVESAALTYGGNTFNIDVDISSEVEYYIEDEDGTEYLLDETAVENMIYGFTDISWMSCAAYNVSDEDLATYGLDDPYVEFSLVYTYTITVESESESGFDDEETEQTVAGNDVLLIGSVANDDGDRYAMIKGGTCVYILSSTIVEYYEISDAEELFSKTLLSFTEDEIDYLTVVYKGETYVINVTSEEGVDDSGYDTVYYTYKYNNTEMELDDFIAAIEEFSAETAYADDITDYGDLLISITVQMTDGTSQTAEIYNYDDDYCVVGNGEYIRYMADESECDDIYDLFKMAIKEITEEEEST